MFTRAEAPRSVFGLAVSSQASIIPLPMVSLTSLNRSLLKGTALFGGTQMINMLTGIVRGKLVATLLGTVGMGISSIYMSTLLPLQQFFSMGIATAIVSVVASLSAETSAAKRDLQERIEACRRVLIVLSLAGMAFMMLSALWLSRFSFGDDAHTKAYALLGVALVFLIMEGGETAFLQSRRCMKEVATRNVITALSGLVVSVPLYWWLGLEGIVPAIIGCAVVSWIYPRLMTRRHDLGCRSLSWSRTWTLGRQAIALGFLLMVGAMLGNVTSYALNVGIRELGSISDVGLYRASQSITGQYVGMVFAAMATDYFPRLSALKERKDDARELVRQEFELVLLIMAPIVALLIVTAPLLIRVLLTKEFLPLTGVIRIIGVSLLCKAAYFPIGYISLAYGRKRFFFWTEAVWDNVKNFCVILGAYYLWGIEGIGWGMLASGLIDVFVTSTLTQWVFGISVQRQMLSVFTPLFAAVALCAALSFCDSPWLSWGGMIVSALCLSAVCIGLLAKRIRFKEWMLRKHGNRQAAQDERDQDS